MPTTLTSSEFEARAGAALDSAASSPVIVTKNGQPKNVVISYAEYQRLLARDIEVFRVEDLTDSELDEIAQAKMEPGLEYLNAELERS